MADKKVTLITEVHNIYTKMEEFNHLHEDDGLSINWSQTNNDVTLEIYPRNSSIMTPYQIEELSKIADEFRTWCVFVNTIGVKMWNRKNEKGSYNSVVTPALEFNFWINSHKWNERDENEE